MLRGFCEVGRNSTREQCEKLLPLSFIIERMSELHHNGCNLVFEKVSSSQFDENMQFVDSRMTEIMGHLLMISYRDDIKDLPSAVKKMSEENPLGFRNTNMN